MKFRRRDDEEDDLWADGWAGSGDAWSEDGDEAATRRWPWLLLLAALALAAGVLLWSRATGQNPDSPTPQPGAVALATQSAAPPTHTPAPQPTPFVGGVTRLAVPSAPPPAPFDPAALAALMLALVNADRAAAGLTPVAWDDTAAAVGAAHAADMVAHGYFSHWNPQGLGPDHRYSAAGGLHAVMENLHAFSYTYTNGRPAPVEDWEVIIRNAQAGLMQSPGHRANILHPAHTHLGIGMAYDPATGQFRLAQEFTNQYAELNPSLPTAARPGDNLRVSGALGPAAVGNAILDLAYEPFPAPLSLDELAARSTYVSPAESVDTRGVDLTFDETFTLPEAPGYYHIRLFVDLASGQAMVVDRVVAVR